jgi:hypothetical protein
MEAARICRGIMECIFSNCWMTAKNEFCKGATLFRYLPGMNEDESKKNVSIIISRSSEVHLKRG